MIQRRNLISPRAFIRGLMDLEVLQLVLNWCIEQLVHCSWKPIKLVWFLHWSLPRTYHHFILDIDDIFIIGTKGLSRHTIKIYSLIKSTPVSWIVNSIILLRVMNELPSMDSKWSVSLWSGLLVMHLFYYKFYNNNYNIKVI